MTILCETCGEPMSLHACPGRKPKIVAPLEWKESVSARSSHRLWFAATPFGNYEILERDSEFAMTFEYRRFGGAASLEEGKARCQAEWDKRVLPCVRLEGECES